MSVACAVISDVRLLRLATAPSLSALRFTSMLALGDAVSVLIAAFFALAAGRGGVDSGGTDSTEAAIWAAAARASTSHTQSKRNLE